MSDGRAEKDEAVARVDRNANEEWRRAARATVKYIAWTMQTFTTDDVWAYLEANYVGLGTHEPRALGAVMSWAAKQGWIEKTDEVRQSERAVAHRNPKQVWQSLRYGERRAVRRSQPIRTPRSVPKPKADKPLTRQEERKSAAKYRPRGGAAREPDPGRRARLEAKRAEIQARLSTM